MGKKYIIIGEDTMAYVTHTMYLTGIGEALLNEYKSPKLIMEESLDQSTKMQRVYSLNAQNFKHTQYKLNMPCKKNSFHRTTNK